MLLNSNADVSCGISPPALCSHCVDSAALCHFTSEPLALPHALHSLCEASSGLVISWGRQDAGFLCNLGLDGQ